LAETIGCTIQELGSRLSSSDYLDWLAWFLLQSENAETDQPDLSENPDYQMAQMRRVLN